jgi:hypothetical protein
MALPEMQQQMRQAGRDFANRRPIEEDDQNNNREHIRRHQAESRRNRTSQARTSSSRRKNHLHEWATEKRSRPNGGRANIDYVKKYSTAAKKAQADKGELLAQHNEILQRMANGEEVTKGEEAFLTSAAAQWSMLSEEEQDATSHLNAMGEGYKRKAQENWQDIQHYSEKIESMTQRQGAGTATIVASTLGSIFVMFLRHDHRERFGWSGIGTDTMTKSEVEYMTKATLIGLKRGHTMGLPGPRL